MGKTRMRFVRAVLLARAAAVFSVSTAIAGCAASGSSGFSDFYQPVETPEHAVAKPLLFKGDPEVRTSADLKQDRILAFERGYVVIGSAFFEGGDASVEAAKRQARSVGAGLVLLSSQSTRRSGFMYSGLRSDQSALFLAPAERKGLGLMLEDISFEEQLRLAQGSAKRVIAVMPDSPEHTADIVPGVTAQRVLAVMPGSPAHTAEIVPGDIIVSIDGSRPSAAIIRSAALGEEESELVVLRGSTRLSKSLVKRWQ
jgi:hypothetical protein